MRLRAATSGNAASPWNNHGANRVSRLLSTLLNGLEGRCSIHLSYRRDWVLYAMCKWLSKKANECAGIGYYDGRGCGLMVWGELA